MLPEIDYSIFKCPATGEDLVPADTTALQMANRFSGGTQNFSAGLVNISSTFFYPVKNNIFFLLKRYAIPFKNFLPQDQVIAFDRQRILNYYERINYLEFEGRQVYAYAGKFVDFRPFVLDYTQHGFYNTRKYLQHTGKYFVDAGCGTVAFKEYALLSEGYDYRINIDQSVKQGPLEINN